MPHSSGGALVAAMISTRTKKELRLFLNEDLHHYLRPCDEGWGTLLLRYWNEKQLFDAKRFRNLLRICLFGDMTFAEAFAKTGRVLNIACTNSRRNGAPILLNHLSTPTVVIWRYQPLPDLKMAPIDCFVAQCRHCFECSAAVPPPDSSGVQDGRWEDCAIHRLWHVLERRCNQGRHSRQAPLGAAQCKLLGRVSSQPAYALRFCSLFTLCSLLLLQMLPRFSSRSDSS